MMQMESGLVPDGCRMPSNITRVIMKTTTIIAIITYAFFLLFVYTSLSKLIAFDYYLYDLKRSPLLGSYAPVIAFLIPFSELLVAALLLPGKSRMYGLTGSLILMTLFTLYVGYVLTFTTSRPCTCGGIIRQLSWPNHLIFNIGFLLLAILGIYLQSKHNNK
jgi:putative oxidoreductase